MLKHEVELLNKIRRIRVVCELDGNNVLADLVRQVADQVERMIEDKASSRASAQESVLKAMASTSNAAVDTSLLTGKQREVMLARLAFVREIERLAAMGFSKAESRRNLVEASRRGELPPHLASLAGMANDRSGGRRGLSSSSLQRWCLGFANGGQAALAPARPGRSKPAPEWATDFLAVYQRPSMPSLADAYRQVFGPPHSPRPGAPSIYAVRRFVKKLSWFLKS